MSEADVYADLKSYLLSTRKDLVLSPGSAINDIFLGPTAYIINKNRVLLAYVQAMQDFTDILALENNPTQLAQIALVQNTTVDQVLAQLSSLVDKIGADFGVTRRGAQYASGIVYFGCANAPSDFQRVINSGSIVSTVDGKQFTTTSSATMGTLNPGQYYDTTENLYLVQVPVQASTIGTAGNVGSYAISKLVTQIAGIQYVLNKDDMSNGVDAETDAEFIARIKAQILGNNYETINGLKSLVLANFPTVKDALVVGADDPLMIRDQGNGGCTDIYVLEESAATTISETHNQYNVKVGTLDGFYLANQPVDSVVSAVNFQQDTTSVLAQSNFAQSLVYYNSPSPALPQTVTIKYFKICQDIFNFLMQPDYKIAGWSNGSLNPSQVSILIRKAIKNALNIQFTLYVKAGFVKATLIPTIQQEIQNFVNALLLGASVAQTQISAVAQNTPGVDYLDFSIFDLNGSLLKTVVSAPSTEYIRVGTLTIL